MASAHGEYAAPPPPTKLERIIGARIRMPGIGTLDAAERVWGTLPERREASMRVRAEANNERGTELSSNAATSFHRPPEEYDEEPPLPMMRVGDAGVRQEHRPSRGECWDQHDHPPTSSTNASTASSQHESDCGDAPEAPPPKLFERAIGARVRGIGTLGAAEKVWGIKTE